MFTPIYEDRYSSCDECTAGNWKVVLWSTNPGWDNENWYIRNTATGTLKKIGRVQLKGKNYYDEAHKIAHERNKLQ